MSGIKEKEFILAINNEDAENVKIVTTQAQLGRESSLTLPKHSITVVKWSD
mgnify:CR=1 FL=1